MKSQPELHIVTGAFGGPAASPAAGTNATFAPCSFQIESRRIVPPLDYPLASLISD